jgi:intein-encoded DNA endonuclease-like protein
MNKINAAYCAGFLDGDGSIYVQMKQNTTYRFGFQISPQIVFFQSQKERLFMEKLWRLINKGYIRERKDGIIELIIGDEKSIRNFLKAVLPYLKVKRKQAKLMLKILNQRKKIKNGSDFLRVARLIDEFRDLNYSKKRKQTSQEVKKVLERERLLTP